MKQFLVAKWQCKQYRPLQINAKCDGERIIHDKIKNTSATDGETINLYAQWEPIKYKIVYHQQYILPEEYQRVEYIESTGTQYIDTGYLPNSLTDVECKFMYNELGGTSTPFGVRESDSSVKQFLVSTTNASVLWIVNGLNNTSISNVNPTINEEYVIRVTPTNAYWNGNNVLNMSSDVANNIKLSMYIFARNTTSGFANPMVGRIYYLRIYENNEIINYFIPCYRKQDNVAGLYDSVNDIFYPNKGSGRFNAGSDAYIEEINFVTETLVYDRPSILLDNDYEKEGYTLVGWNTRKDGNGKMFYSGEEVVNLSSIEGETINLYPIWKKDLE